MFLETSELDGGEAEKVSNSNKIKRTTSVCINKSKHSNKVLLLREQILKSYEYVIVVGKIIHTEFSTI